MKSESKCSNLLTFSTFFIINGSAVVKRFSGGGGAAGRPPAGPADSLTGSGETRCAF